MPELPEVETIVRALKFGGRQEPPVIDCVLTGGKVLWEKTLANPPAALFSQRLTGQKVMDVTRRGKFISLNLSDDTLLIHLRMSGDIRVDSARAEDEVDRPLRRHDRLLLYFENGLRLVLNDTRKFARAWLVRDPAVVLSTLGPEPLDHEFSAERLGALLSKRQRGIKSLLMDQTVLAGMGNIYTDEALHLARIHPLARPDQLTTADIEHLWLAIQSVLKEGIRRNGASIDWVYRGGDFQNYFRVYGRSGQPCPVCGTLITKTVIGQRGTHYCPTCQPPPPGKRG